MPLASVRGSKVSPLRWLFDGGNKMTIHLLGVCQRFVGWGGLDWVIFGGGGDTFCENEFLNILSLGILTVHYLGFVFRFVGVYLQGATRFQALF